MYVREMTAGDVALFVGGAVVFFIAAFIMWGRNWVTREQGDGGAVFSFPGVGAVSEPTRLLVGCFGIMLAYHMMVWSLPARATSFQFPRSRWWVFVMVGTGAVGGSLLLDRQERDIRDPSAGDGEA